MLVIDTDTHRRELSHRLGVTSLNLRNQEITVQPHLFLKVLSAEQYHLKDEFTRLCPAQPGDQHYDYILVDSPAFYSE